ncbi:hypothetical protein BD560DRAFT_400702 [Blakeslea trispora]|nr:hypothetical protein BD560DRAFT_400702 [Blakeslea trispora]
MLHLAIHPVFSSIPFSFPPLPFFLTEERYKRIKRRVKMNGVILFKRSDKIYISVRFFPLLYVWLPFVCNVSWCPLR